MDHVKRKIIIKYIAVQIKYTKIKGNYKEEWHKPEVPMFLSLTFFKKDTMLWKDIILGYQPYICDLKKPVLQADCSSFLHPTSVNILVMCLILKSSSSLKKDFKNYYLKAIYTDTHFY